MQRLFVNGQRIVDENGGEILLNGLNFVCKDKALGYVMPCRFPEELFSWFEKQGFNALRMGLIWDGVEPNPGEYDDSYLARIKEQVLWAQKHNIYVFLDMHQDLYSVLYGDGAPKWATISLGAPHIEGEVWSDAYLESPAVINSIDAFWANTPIEESGMAGGEESERRKGLLDSFADMWEHCSKFFADCENIIGYDVYNEPFPGSSGGEVMEALLAGYSAEISGENENASEAPSALELSQMWFSQEQKQKLLHSLEDMSLYSRLTGAAQEASQKFEKQTLSGFYARMDKAVNKSSLNKIMMLETSYFSNMGIESGIEIEFNAPVVYAPHGYDLVVDTDHYEVYNKSRVEFIFETHRKVQQRLNSPVLVGEWGAFNQNPLTPSLVKLHVEIFEKYLWSNTYWCWYDGMRDLCFAEYLCRGYPMRTGGKLISYHYDYDTGVFNMKYISDGSPCRIFYPGKGIVEVTRPAGEAEIII